MTPQPSDWWVIFQALGSILLVLAIYIVGGIILEALFPAWFLVVIAAVYIVSLFA